MRYEVDLDSEWCQSCSRHPNNVTSSDRPTLVQAEAQQRRTSPLVMIVGEAPEKTEVSEGRPFVGPSGRLLNELLEECRIDRATLYITNAVRCYYAPVKPAQDKQALECCRHHLIQEIDFIKPDFIITLGEPALRQVQQKRTISQHRGAVRSVTFDGSERVYRTFATYHPAYILRDPSKRPYLKKDLEEAFRIVQGKPHQKCEVSYKVIRTYEQWRLVFQRLCKEKVIFWDTETSAWDRREGKQVGDPLDYQHSFLLCMSFSWKPYTAVVLPFCREAAKPVWSFHEWKLIVRDLLHVFSIPNKLWVGHNIKFDFRALSRLVPHHLDRLYPRYRDDESVKSLSFAHVYPRFFDTQYGHKLLDETAPSSLKDLALLYTDLGAYEQDILKKHGLMSDKMTFKKLKDYLQSQES